MMTGIKEKIRQYFYVCPYKCKKELNIFCELSRMECILEKFSKKVRRMLLAPNRKNKCGR